MIGRAPLLAASLLALPAGAAGLDAALHAEILRRYSSEVPDAAGVRIDYRGLAAAPEWSRLVGELASVDPSRLVTPPERLALWINAYNLLAIDLVVRHPGVASIRDIGSFLRPVWSRTAGRVGGADRSLGAIEHEILRPMGDPRIHGAIVCASVSCPSLRREPYAPERLDEQLDDQIRRWLASSDKGLRIDTGSRTIHLSPVFDWFDEDFEPVGGVLAFVARYAPEAQRRWLDAHASGARIRYLPYDWSVNALTPQGSSGAPRPVR